LLQVDSRSPEGEGAFVNAPIAVTLVETEQEVFAAPMPTLELLRVDTMEVVPAFAVRANELQWSFRPEPVLASGTTYRATVNLGQTDGSTDVTQPPVTWEFTTGDTAAPTVALEGELQVTLVEGTDPIQDCVCGSCSDTGELLRVTKARVVLPRVLDGFGPRHGELWLTNDRPYAFTTEMKEPPDPTYESFLELGGWVPVDGDAPGEVLRTVPSEDRAYRLCVAFRAMDARGDVAYAAPVCLEEFDFPVEQPLGADPQPPVGPDAEPPAAASSRTTSACSLVAPQGAVSAGASWAGLALLGLLLRRRARTGR
jgi:hypothetical protein